MKRLILFIIIFISVLVLTSIYLSRQKTTGELTLYGNVDVRQVDLGFRVSGRVISMPFQEGDFIKEKTLIAILDDQPYKDQVKQARAAVDSTKAILQNSELLLKRRKELISSGSTSQEDYETALSNRDVAEAQVNQAEANLGVALTSLGDTQIFAPSEGIILTRIREPGSVVKPADPVYTLTLNDPVWIRAFVTEPQLGLIYPGMKAEIHTDTPGGSAYTGHIGFISPVAEFTPKNVETTELRTDLVYRLRIIAENPDKGLKQGMPVTVKLFLQP